MSSEFKPPEEEGALKIWREKLEFLLEQEAIESNPLVLWNLKYRIREARSKFEALERGKKKSSFEIKTRAAVVFLVALPVLLGVLGQRTHRSRETMLRLPAPLTYSSTALIRTGAEAVGALAANGLTAPLSSRPEVRTSAWALLALTGLCLAAFRWHGRKRWLSRWLPEGALALALVVLWVGIHFYTFALRARHGVEEPGDTKALCSTYFLGERASISQQIVVESCFWLLHPTGTNGPWRQNLSGLVVLFLLASGGVLHGGVRLGRREGWRGNVRRLLLGGHAVVLLLVFRQVPLAHAYERWGLDYPVAGEETECCRYDVSEGALTPAFVLWGPSCSERTFLQSGERLAADGVRRTISPECGR